MSTETAAAQKKLFNEASAQRLPKLVCTGYVGVVGEGKESKSGNYNNNPVEILGFGASKNIKVYVLTRPEWFELDDQGNPSFRPDDLENVEGGKGMLFVYRKNIKGRGSVSNLEGLCGTKERFENLQEAFFEDDDVADENLSATAIERILTNHLLPKDGESPVEIGYVLKQQSTKTDEKDENGKTVYILENRYEIEKFFEPTEEVKAKFRKSAEKAAKRAAESGKPVSLKIAFDNGVPF